MGPGGAVGGGGPAPLLLMPLPVRRVLGCRTAVPLYRQEFVELVALLGAEEGGPRDSNTLTLASDGDDTAGERPVMIEEPPRMKVGRRRGRCACAVQRAVASVRW